MFPSFQSTYPLPPAASTAAAEAPSVSGQPDGVTAAHHQHIAMLQQQLQQTQAHAQAQAHLLALYQHSPPQTSAAQQLAVPYPVPTTVPTIPQGAPPVAGAPHPYYQPNLMHYHQMHQSAYSAAYAAAAAAHAAAVTNPTPANAPAPSATAPSVAPTAAAPPAQSRTPPADPRIHVDLTNLEHRGVKWTALPPRFALEAAARNATSKRQQILDAAWSATGSEEPRPTPDAKTVFVGGISYDVARDPRVLPWLVAEMSGELPVVVRKVVPHKERRAAPDAKQADGQSQSKLALSAFVVVDADQVQDAIHQLHHRVLWDVGGCWIASSDGAAEALKEYVNTQCTWQRREAGAAAGLPRHLMTVECATAAGSSNHALSALHQRQKHVSKKPVPEQPVSTPATGSPGSMCEKTIQKDAGPPQPTLPDTPPTLLGLDLWDSGEPTGAPL